MGTCGREDEGERLEEEREDVWDEEWVVRRGGGPMRRISGLLEKYGEMHDIRRKLQHHDFEPTL